MRLIVFLLTCISCSGQNLIVDPYKFASSGVTTNFLSDTNNLSVNLLDSWGNTSNSTYYISNPFTPSTNATLILELAVTPTGTVTVTNTGTTQLTWWQAKTTNFNTIASPASQHDVWVTQLPQGTAPFSMTVVAKWGSGTGCNMHVLEVTGADQSKAYGTNAILQSAVEATNAIVGMAVKFAAAAGNGGFDAVIGAFGDDVNSASDNAAGSGFTEIAETTVATPTTAFTTVYQLSSTASFVTNSASSRDWGASAIEVRARTNYLATNINVIHQDFETGTLPTYWTEAGSVTWNYTPSLHGTYSMSVNNAFSDQARVYWVGEVSDLWIFFRIKLSAITSSPPMVYFQDSRGTTMGKCNLNSDGTIGSTHGTQTTGGGSGFAAATEYYVWAHYKSATSISSPNGILATYVSTTSTRPAVTANCTTGTSAGAISSLSFEPYPDLTVYQIDDVIVRFGNIGDDPF